MALASFLVLLVGRDGDERRRLAEALRTDYFDVTEVNSSYKAVKLLEQEKFPASADTRRPEPPVRRFDAILWMLNFWFDHTDSGADEKELFRFRSPRLPLVVYHPDTFHLSFQDGNLHWMDKFHTLGMQGDGWKVSLPDEGHILVALKVLRAARFHGPGGIHT